MIDSSGASQAIDELLVEWDGVWLESLKSQIYDIQHRRQLHDEFMAMLDGQDHPDTEIFRDAFHRMYVEAQVMAIRRQADDDKRTLSLRRLIGQLEQHRRGFTRDWYVRRWLETEIWPAPMSECDSGADAPRHGERCVRRVHRQTRRRTAKGVTRTSPRSSGDRATAS